MDNTQKLVAESRLISQAQNGDRDAFCALASHYYPDVIRVVYRMCGDSALAEDATQEAFLRAWLNIASFQPRATFNCWLYRIAVNAALDVLRRKPEVELDDEMPLADDPAPGPEAMVIEKQQSEVVQQALRALPEAARTTIVLREYGGLSYQEISAALEVPVGTVMSRLNYARNRLRELLSAQMLLTEMEHA